MVILKEEFTIVSVAEVGYMEPKSASDFRQVSGQTHFAEAVLGCNL